MNSNEPDPDVSKRDPDGSQAEHSSVDSSLVDASQIENVEQDSKLVGSPSANPSVEPVVEISPIPTEQAVNASVSEQKFNSNQVIDSPSVSVESISVGPARTLVGMSLELSRVFIIPVLIVGAFITGITLLGVAQRYGWIASASASGQSDGGSSSSQLTDVSYICPMMCVPPTNQPGRCPVCAMELVPASSNSSSGPSSEIQIDPRSRRVAGIETVVAKSQLLSREVRGVGEISYDESKLKTLSAYIDGRIEELYADYTGIEVKKGDSLALLYSPELYGAQVEYARILEFVEKAEGTNARIADSNQRLLESSRERLVELGMTDEQVIKLENDKVANRRLVLHAPISGTVIEKMATAGQYIEAGTPIYRLADLSTVWLILELFPEDARSIQIGQPVVALTQSMGDIECKGVVEFIEPTVDPKTRTVGVRVAIKNELGQLKPGEFVKATLTIPLLSKDGMPQATIVIPRNSLLSIGQTSLAYVEKKPGEFELRHVKTGPVVGGQVAILDGISAGEFVVSRSTFLLDAQMQLQGNPSLMDPNKAVAPDPNEVELTEVELEEIRVALEPLGDTDRALAQKQIICPVTEAHLGSLGMGTPIKLDIEGRTVFICCEGCREDWVDEPDKYFKVLDDYLAGKPKPAKAPISDSKDTQKNDGNDLPQMELPQMDLPKMKPPGG